MTLHQIASVTITQWTLGVLPVCPAHRWRRVLLSAASAQGSSWLSWGVRGSGAPRADTAGSEHGPWVTGLRGFQYPQDGSGEASRRMWGPCCSFPESPWKRSVLGRNRATDPEIKGESLRGPLLGPLTSAAKPACPFDPETINNPKGHTCQRPLWAPPPRPCALRRRRDVTGSAPQTTLRSPPRLHSA